MHDSAPIDYLTAEEATARLGIKTQTLYAYVSRQLIRRITPANSKRSLYSREDVESLAEKRVRGSKAKPSERPDLPSLASRPERASPRSAITQITSLGPVYRGHRFDMLAEHPACIENVAELLWSGVLLDEPVTWELGPIPANLDVLLPALQTGPQRVPILRVMGTASIALGASANTELQAGNTVALARRLVCAYAGCLAMLTDNPRFVRPVSGESVAQIAARAMGLELSPLVLSGLNAILITCADHELSADTYATRVIASTGAGIHACLLGGIAAQSGHLLGGSCDRNEAFYRNPASRQGLYEQVDQGFAENRKLAGFGHPLYPEGDPRARYLLQFVQRFFPSGPASEVLSLVQAISDKTGQHPSLELGLIAMALGLGLPSRGASALWAVGRSIGWVAHVMEQRLAGTLIPPRSSSPAG